MVPYTIKGGPASPNEKLVAERDVARETRRSNIVLWRM